MQRDELVYAYFDTRTHREPVSRWKNWVFARPGEDWQGGHHTYAGHTGTDFLLPVGTAVLAMASGYLTHTSADFSGGLTAFLDYGGGVATSFRHLQQIFCAPGTYVKRGECVGTSGRSGIIQWSGGLIPPHLHVTLWVNGLPTDLFQNGRDPQSMCYWINNENKPRRALSGDEQWDYTQQWCLLDKATLLKQAALTDSIAWSNFWQYASRLLPDELSISDASTSQPRLSLPFHSS